ncbi:restriction endonuclease subunit S [Photorhabdus kleinii]|uniref:restriction endonuclease subunit S n=1 Tax=Photorhabdus kleinii TaxID=768034 RepID=UPI0021D4D2BB|nr:restriction endonuclease subunit S [Photorhabdus kleinii]MCT8344488.1 restriction endonuclease subunit S [Photorhabdus kleinii]
MGSKWPLVRLGDFCLKIGSGATPKGGSNVYDTTGSTYLIRSQNIYNDGFNTNGLVYISDEAATKLKNVIVQKNDVLLNITGDSVARVCLAQECFLPARVNQHVAIIRPNPKDFDPRFLRYYLASPYQQQTLLNLASAGATRNALTKGMIENLEVPKPPLNIQYIIANNLECFDSKISNNIQINQTLEQMAQSLFKSWFVDFDPVIDNALEAGNPIPETFQERAELRQKIRKSADFKPLSTEIRALFPAEFEETELGWVPKGWKHSSLDKIAHYQNGLALQKFRPDNETDDFLPVLKIADLRKGYIAGIEKARKDIIESCRVHNGDMIFSWSGTLMIDIWTSGDAALNQHLYKVTSDRYPLSFYLMWTKKHLSRFQHIAASKAVTMGHIKKRDLSESMCLIPSKELIKKYDFFANPYIQQSTNIRLQNNSLTQLRDTLLPKLISGELSLDDLPEAINEAKAA